MSYLILSDDLLEDTYIILKKVLIAHNRPTKHAKFWFGVSSPQTMIKAFQYLWLGGQIASNTQLQNVKETMYYTETILASHRPFPVL